MGRVETETKEKKSLSEEQRSMAMEVVKFFDGEEEDYLAFMESKGYSLEE